MTDNKETELLPCPFCGARLQRQQTSSGHWYEHMGEVEDCYATGSIIFDENIAAWNRRPAATSEAVSGDYVLVPREPTEAMLDAAWWNGPDVERIAATRSPRDRAKLMYRAMLAAAPASPDRQTRDGDTRTYRDGVVAAIDAFEAVHDNQAPEGADYSQVTQALEALLVPAVEKEQDGWIEWKGGPQPVRDGTFIMWKLWQNGQNTVCGPGVPEGLEWTHGPSGPRFNDIVGYRLFNIVPPTQSGDAK